MQEERRAAQGGEAKPEAALAAAMRARDARAKVRKAVKEGTATVAQVLADDDPAVSGMRPKALLLALPGVGQSKADAMLAAAGIDPGRRLRGLGSRQRAALVALVDAHMAELAAREAGRAGDGRRAR